MALVRWQPRTYFSGPFHRFDQFDRMDGVFDRVWNGWEDTHNASGYKGFWHPAMDVWETDDALEIYAELPGVRRDDFKLTVNDNTLIVEGEKKLNDAAEERHCYHNERSFGHFRRSFTLPFAVNTDNITAAFKDGILMLTLPKSESAKPKLIEVSAA